MELVTKKDIQGLFSINNVCCVSIFIPTSRTREEVLNRKDAILLKNQLKEVRTKLVREALAISDIDDLIAPIQALIYNSGFWRHQEDGLAIFLAEGIFKLYPLPVDFKPLNHIGNSFYLLPLLPLFSGDGSFFLLFLELGTVKLFRQTRYKSTELAIKEVIPVRLEEWVGYDYEQKDLQFRSGQDSHGAAIFHGQGEIKGDRKEEISRYFRAINKGLMTLIHEENRPMVVACQDYLFPIYQKVNTYKYLVDGPISCNLSETDEHMLRRLAWEKLEPIFNLERSEKVDLFKQYEGTGRTSSEISEVVPASMEGRIDTLFVPADEDMLDTYDAGATHVSLLNRAAISTFLHHGKVYVVKQQDMPNPQVMVNALYRY